MATLLCDPVGPDAKSHALSRTERRKLKVQARTDALKPMQQKLQSKDPAEQLEAVDELFLQFEKTSLDTLLAADLLPWVLQLSQESTNLELQTQVLWALCRFSEGTPEQTRCLVEQGALQRLMPLLTGPPRTQEQAAGLLRAVCTWPCTKFADGLSKRLLIALSLLLASNDENVLIHVCEALAMLRYSDPQHLAVLLIRGAIERLVFLLETASREVQARACHALQRVACASTRGMQALLVCEPLPALKEMMESEDPAVQLEGTVLVANTIAFGGPHVEEVLKIGCVPLLLECLRGREETYPETRRAAARGLCALNKRAPQPELWEAPMVAAVLGALPSDASALDFLVSVLRLTPGDLSQKLREAACAFLENCGLDDSLQGQVQEALLLLQETQGERA